MKKRTVSPAAPSVPPRMPIPSHSNGFIFLPPAVPRAARVRRRRGEVARKLGGPPC